MVTELFLIGRSASKDLIYFSIYVWKERFYDCLRKQEKLGPGATMIYGFYIRTTERAVWPQISTIRIVTTH